jgi:hypothetical protein
VVSGADRAGGSVPNEQRADRKAVAQPLRERHEVGLDADLLVGEERPGPSDSRLHLVDAEERADLTRDLRRRLHETVVQRNDAALPEDRLENDRRQVAAWGDGGLQGLDVVRPGERDAGKERLESLPLGRLPRRRQSAERPPVEAAVERDDARPAGRLPGDLERCLVRLGARVAEKRLSPAHALGEKTGEPQHRLGPVEVRRVPEGVQLGVRSGGDNGMAVSEPDDRKPAGEVEIGAPGVVPDAASLAADDREIRARVRRQHGVARRS